MRQFCVFLSIILTFLTACGSDENIRNPETHFLLKPGKGRGELGFSSHIRSNNDILPLQHGTIDFNNNRITILDNHNKKIMRFRKDGVLEAEYPLPPKTHKGMNTAITVDSDGRIFFFSARNSDKGRILRLWQLHKKKFKALQEFKTVSSSTTDNGIKTTVTSIPTSLIPLDDEKLSIVWKSQIIKTRRNIQTGQNDYIFSSYTVSRLQILTHETAALRTLDLQPSYFTNRAGNGYRFRRIDTVYPMSGGNNILVVAGYLNRKNGRHIKKMLFSVDLKSGGAGTIPISGDRWSAVLGITDDNRIYTLDMVYNREQKTRAAISIWKSDGSKIFTFRIESNPSSSILGGLFLARDGILYSFHRLQSNIYSRHSGIRFLSWK